MKKGWIKAKLSDVAKVQSGSGFPERYQGNEDQGIPFYKVSDMNIPGNEREVFSANNTISEDVRKQLGANIFPKGTTIFPKIGGAIATNKKRLTTQACCVDNNVMGVIRKKENIDRDFLFYFFFAHDLSEFASEAHLPSIRKTVVEDWEIKLPAALPEQRRIVGILDKAFEGIATAKANAEKNLQNARALFESHLQSVFTQRGKRWVDAKLADVCHRITDGTHTTPTYVTEGVPFLSVKNLTRGFIDFSDTRFISLAEHEFLTRRCKPMRDDVLYTKVGTTGVAQVVDVDEEFSIFVSVALLKPKHEVVFNLYLEHFLNAPYAREQAQKRTRGMANRNLVITDIKEIDVHFPKALDEQRRIVAELESLSDETRRLESIYDRKLAALEALKKSLLHQAFTGAL